MNDSVDPLSHIGFITIPEKLVKTFSAFYLDPHIMLPVEFGDTKEKWNIKNITWESIIAGILRVLIHQPDHENAAYYRKLIVTLKPDIKQEFTEAGIIKAKNKNFIIAIEIFQALSALFPYCALSALNLSLVYEDAAEFDKGKNPKEYEKYNDLAFTWYKEALKRDPELPEIHKNFGFFFLKKESYHKAKEQFELYLQLEKNVVKHAQIKKIVTELDSSLLQDKLFKEAFDNISMGQEQEGIKKITIFLEKNPCFWNGWFLLGWGLRRLKRFEEAKNAFLKALDFTKPNPDLLNELAISYMELGDLTQSEEQLKKALKLELHNTKVISNLGLLYLKKGDTEQAKGFFNTVLEFSPNDPIALSYIKKL